MTVSVRMDPLLERELEQAAQRQGLSKSQFIISAVERALGKKNPYELMMELKAEEQRAVYQVEEPRAAPYDTVKSKVALKKKLQAKHYVRGAR
jgi:predicted DNA-binding protein